MKSPDDNARAISGTLPADPSADTERARPALRAVSSEDRRTATTMPADLAAERALLGALLWAAQNQPELVRVASVLDLLPTGEVFFQRRHGTIYDAARACYDSKREHDPVAVHAELVRQGIDRSCGGLDALRELVASASTINEKQLRVYAESIRSTWVRRCAIAEAQAIIEAARDPKTDGSALIERTQAAAAALAERSANTSSVVSIKQSAMEFFKDIERKDGNGKMPTGIAGLDRCLNGGLNPRETTILAAATSVGKSILAAQIAQHINESNPACAALYVTLEMTHKRFTGRLISARSGVPASVFRQGEGLTAPQWSRVTETVRELAERGIYFIDVYPQTMAKIFASALELNRALRPEGKRVGVVVIDTVALVKPSADLPKNTNREQQIADTSRALRAIATNLACHVIGIVHISREGQKESGNRMPQKRHLRESGALENDADNVLILHRAIDPDSGIPEPGRPAALAVAKARNDETGIMLLDFEPSTVRFSDYSGDSTFAREFGGNRS